MMEKEKEIKTLIQRVKRSSVTVNGKVVASIDDGLNVLLGVGKEDSEDEAKYISDKIANLRIFKDNEGKLNLSVKDIGGQILLISQFTLYADTRKGRRPSFTDAAEPQEAQRYFDKVVNLLEEEHGLDVKKGVFGAHMLIKIENDGPVTIILEK